MWTKSDSTKKSDSTGVTTAPKVRARRLTTSLRAGAISTGGGDVGDGGGGTPDGGAGGDGPPPYDGCYVTYGSLNTWSCR